jgi:mono/diheme cytochrome c family protein
MKSKTETKNSCVRFGLCLALAAGMLGCDNEPPRFYLDMVWIHNNDDPDPEVAFQPGQLQNLSNILSATFGTPDEPYVLQDAGIGMGKLVNSDLLKMAAGPVWSDQQGKAHGLYRKHCAHCHGVSGDGAGPTAAYLNPYPRDYRRGIFKFKSTPKGEKPTDSDLEKTLREGIPGTAMPSFDLLADDEIVSLVDYVKFLAIRGEVERNLVLELSDLEAGEWLVSPETPEDGMELIQSTVSFVVDRWGRAESKVAIPVACPSSADPRTATAEEMEQSITRGYHLFHGVVANCFSCHGQTALGDGQLDLYDDWTEELKPNDPELHAKLMSRAQRPQPVRNLRPRNLRLGVYRGGRRPLDIYWRLINGIDGAKMPQVPLVDPNDPEKPGLNDSDLWDLINYVRSLPYETLSRPPYESPIDHVQLTKPL